MGENTDSSNIVRRDFLKTVGAAGAATGLYAQGGFGTGVVNASADLDRAVTEQADELVGDLAAPYGSEYRRETSELYFVENAGGSISKLDLLTEADGVASYGWATIRGTFEFDFDTGQEADEGGGISGGTADIQWAIIDDQNRQIEPINDAEVAYLGDVEFEDVSAESLQELTYSTDPIDGSVGSNDLFEGAVFACKTNGGNYAKAEVLDVEEGSGDDRFLYDMTIVFVTYELSDEYSRIGTGYSQPMDIVLTGDGERAYVTERGGTLLEVDLDNPDRSAATVITSGLDRPQQLWLDEPRERAYLVEYGGDARLLRIDLNNGSVDELFTDLQEPRGLLVDDEREFAYVTEQNGSAEEGRLRRIGLRDDSDEMLVEGLVSPFFLTWADEAQEAILLTERFPVSRVSKFTLGDRRLLRLGEDLPGGLASVALKSPDELLLCTEGLIAILDLLEELFPLDPPLFMGIGDIPVGQISQPGGGTSPDDVGYATTQGQGFPLQTTDAPFGGTLPLRFNHTDAYQDYNARYYRLFLDGAQPQQSWRALRWDLLIGRYLPEPVSPSTNGFYEVHRPNSLWYRPKRGYELNTRPYANGVHTIAVEFYERKDPATQVARESVDVRFDNTEPRVEIDAVIHNSQSQGKVVVPACAIVDEPNNQFKFEITAEDPESHLRNYNLKAFWGNNRNKSVYDDNYSSHDSGSSDTEWRGPRQKRVPPQKPSDPNYWNADQTQCAHTFRLRAWDRTVNGRNHIHREGYRKSLTLFF